MRAVTVKQAWDEALRDIGGEGFGHDGELDSVVQIGFAAGLMKALELVLSGRKIDTGDAIQFLRAAQRNTRTRVESLRARRAARDRDLGASAN